LKFQEVVKQIQNAGNVVFAVAQTHLLQGVVAMREGCGMVKEGGLEGGEKAVEVETKVVPSRREKQREVERKAQNALPKKKERKFNSYGKKCGRKAGSKNVYVGAREFKKIPEVHQETLYWKAHKMVSQPRDMTAVMDGKVVKVG
jgi:hypothetical protein